MAALKLSTHRIRHYACGIQKWRLYILKTGMLFMLSQKIDTAL